MGLEAKLEWKNAALWVCLLALGAARLFAQQSASHADTPAVPPSGDAKEIVRRSLDEDQRSFDLEKNYTYQQREELRVLGKGGAAKKHQITTYDVTILYDEPYRRRIAKDDKPLSESEAKREAEKMDRFVAERKHETPGEHQKRLEKQEKERQQARAFVRDVINAYNFELAGEEVLAGHNSYVITATPRNDFRPTQPHADILSKLQGKIWISKEDFGCLKLEAETLDTISLGWFLVRIHRGTRIELQQTHVNNEIWLPRRMTLNASARIALFANGVIDWESSFSSYKKFTSGVRILSGATEVQPALGAPR